MGKDCLQLSKIRRRRRRGKRKSNKIGILAINIFIMDRNCQLSKIDIMNSRILGISSIIQLQLSSWSISHHFSIPKEEFYILESMIHQLYMDSSFHSINSTNSFSPSISKANSTFTPHWCLKSTVFDVYQWNPTKKEEIFGYYRSRWLLFRKIERYWPPTIDNASCGWMPPLTS